MLARHPYNSFEPVCDLCGQTMGCPSPCTGCGRVQACHICRYKCGREAHGDYGLEWRCGQCLAVFEILDILRGKKA